MSCFISAPFIFEQGEQRRRLVVVVERTWSLRWSFVRCDGVSSRTRALVALADLSTHAPLLSQRRRNAALLFFLADLGARFHDVHCGWRRLVFGVVSGARVVVFVLLARWQLTKTQIGVVPTSAARIDWNLFADAVNTTANRYAAVQLGSMFMSNE